MLEELFIEVERHAVLRYHAHLIRGARQEYKKMKTAIKLLSGAPVERLTYLKENNIPFKVDADYPDSEWRKRIVEHLCGWLHED